MNISAISAYGILSTTYGPTNFFIFCHTFYFYVAPGTKKASGIQNRRTIQPALVLPLHLISSLSKSQQFHSFCESKDPDTAITATIVFRSETSGVKLRNIFFKKANNSAHFVWAKNWTRQSQRPSKDTRILPRKARPVYQANQQSGDSGKDQNAALSPSRRQATMTTSKLLRRIECPTKISPKAWHQLTKLEAAAENNPVLWQDPSFMDKSFQKNFKEYWPQRIVDGYMIPLWYYPTIFAICFVTRLVISYKQWN